MPPAWFEKWGWRSGMRNTVLQWTERGPSSCHMDVSIANARFVHHVYQRFEIRWSRQFPAADTHESSPAHHIDRTDPGWPRACLYRRQADRPATPGQRPGTRRADDADARMWPLR